MKRIRLQQMGMVEAKPAQEFQIGEVMGWNFGARSEVLGIVKETNSFITFKISGCGRYGEIDKSVTYERRLKKTRLVAIG